MEEPQELPDLPTGASGRLEEVVGVGVIDSDSTSSFENKASVVRKPSQLLQNSTTRERGLKRFASDTLHPPDAPGFRTGHALSSTGSRQQPIANQIESQIDILTCEVPDCDHTSKDSRPSTLG